MIAETGGSDEVSGWDVEEILLCLRRSISAGGYTGVYPVYGTVG